MKNTIIILAAITVYVIFVYNIFAFQDIKTPEKYLATNSYERAGLVLVDIDKDFLEKGYMSDDFPTYGVGSTGRDAYYVAYFFATRAFKNEVEQKEKYFKAQY